MRVANPVSLRRWARGLVAVLYLLVLVGLVVIWRDPVWRHWLAPQSLSEMGRTLLTTPLGPVAVLCGYVLAVIMAVPVIVLITVGSLVFGPWPGMAYAMAGMVLGAVVTYGAGRLAGGAWLGKPHELAPSRLALLATQLQRRGMWAVALVRLFPVAPFLVVNLMAGAVGIRLRDFALGTFLGLLPGTVLISLFLDRLRAAWASPGPLTYTALAAAVLGLLGLAWWFKRRLLRER